MYTEPHVDARSVWLTFEQGGETAHLRLWPQSDAMADWRSQVSLGGSAALGRITAAAERLRYYPGDAAAKALLDNASRVRWRHDLSGGMTPDQGKTFSQGALSLQIFENEHDIRASSITRVPVYAFDGEG